MEVEEVLVAQAPTNVEQGKEIATLMLTVAAIYNVVKVVEMMTTVILPWVSLLIMTAAMNQVRHFKAPKKVFLFVQCLFRLESEFRKKNKGLGI